jgi:uncharacterized protein with PIN domain
MTFLRCLQLKLRRNLRLDGIDVTCPKSYTINQMISNSINLARVLLERGFLFETRREI